MWGSLCSLYLEGPFLSLFPCLSLPNFPIDHLLYSKKNRGKLPKLHCLSPLITSLSHFPFPSHLCFAAIHLILRHNSSHEKIKETQKLARKRGREIEYASKKSLVSCTKMMSLLLFHPLSMFRNYTSKERKTAYRELWWENANHLPN